jgi:hypothetical protein
MTTAVINYIDFYENTNIQHSSDISVFGRTPGNTDSSTQLRLQKQYQSGSALRKVFYEYDRPRTRTFINRVSLRRIQIDSTQGIRDGFFVTGGTAYDGTYVLSVMSATWILLSSPPVGTPDPLVPITFYTSTNRITVGNTTGISAGWNMTGNGYTIRSVVTVIDSTHIFLDGPPTTPPSLNGTAYVHFRAPSPYIVVNNTTGLLPGYKVYANDNAYTGSYILSVEPGNVVMLSDEANSYSSPGDLINFIDETPLGTIPPLGTKTFSADYTRVGSAPYGTYTGTIAIGAFHFSPVLKYVSNFVTIAAVPPPVPAAPTYNYVTNNRGGGGGGGGGGTSPGSVSPGTCPGAGDPGTGQGCTPGSAGSTGGGVGCCFIMLEARYGDGTMDSVVRRYRDEKMTDRNRRGYYKVAEVLVPLMRESRVFKFLITKTFSDPLVCYGKHYYGENCWGWIFSPLKTFWMKIFDVIGGDTKFIRENGEDV